MSTLNSNEFMNLGKQSDTQQARSDGIGKNEVYTHISCCTYT